jgi:hypothetical protein
MASAITAVNQPRSCRDEPWRVGGAWGVTTEGAYRFGAEGYPLRYSAHYILCRRFRRCEGGRGFVGAGAIPLVSVS